jgi:hypothetical protein
MPQKMLFWPPFATSLPPKSKSKVASTQSKQENTVMNGVWRPHAFPRRGAAQAACLEKLEKERKSYAPTVKFRNAHNFSY